MDPRKEELTHSLPPQQLLLSPSLGIAVLFFDVGQVESITRGQFSPNFFLTPVLNFAFFYSREIS